MKRERSVGKKIDNGRKTGKQITKQSEPGESTPLVIDKEPNADLVSPEDLRKHFTDRLWTNVTRTNTQLLAWITAMSLIFISAIFPLITQVNKIERERAKLEEKQKALDKVQKLKSEAAQQKPTPSNTNAAGNSSNLSNSQNNNSNNAGNNNSSKVGRVDPNLKRLKESADKQKAAVETKIKEINQLQNQLSNIATPLGSLPIPTFYVPLVWSFLFVGLLAFFLYRRVIIATLLAKVVDLNLTGCKKDIDQIKGLGAGIPFWLAPLPKSIQRSDGKEIAKEDLQNFLGWVEKPPYSTLTVAIIGAGLLLYLWVGWITYRVSENYFDPQSTRGVRLILASLFVACLVACYFWFRPEIKLSDFSSKISGLTIPRRTFIASCSVLFLGSIAYGMMPRKYLPRKLAAQARRKRNPPPDGFDADMRYKFWINHRTKTLHYIGGKGYIGRNSVNNPTSLISFSGVEVLQLLAVNPQTLPSSPELMLKKIPLPENLVQAYPTQNNQIMVADKSPSPLVASKVSETKAGKNAQKILAAENSKPTIPNYILFYEVRLNGLQIGPVTECAALEQLQKGNVEAALQTIWNGIQWDTAIKQRNRTKKSKPKQPDYRLYDLLFGLSHRHSNQSYKQKLIEHVQENWSDDMQLAKRRSRWANPSQLFHQRWTAETISWKTPFKENSSYHGLKFS